LERTFVMIKPDGVQRGLIGDIITRLERRGRKLIAASSSRCLGVRKHFTPSIKENLFCDGLLQYITASR
jgi:nucleoside-diphosphate kinase